MVHDLSGYQRNLLRSSSYCASPNFLSDIRWDYETWGPVVVNKTTNKNMVISVVGRVLDFRLRVSPSGIYTSDWCGDFSTAKFQFLLGTPVDTPFDNDFAIVLEHLEKLQSDVASTLDRRNLIILGAPSQGKKSLRLTRNVFEKSEHPIQQNGTEHVDDVTEYWPVEADLQADLDKIKFDFKASPLPVYVENQNRVVQPEDVQETLRGALVEVQFELRHFHIQRENRDSFNATVQQVLVLQPGVAEATQDA